MQSIHESQPISVRVDVVAVAVVVAVTVVSVMVVTVVPVTVDMVEVEGTHIAQHCSSWNCGHSQPYCEKKLQVVAAYVTSGPSSSVAMKSANGPISILDMF